ncbi:MAG: hypothetical protein ACRDLR_03895, partial [Gaiellaceae bacterium]
DRGGIGRYTLTVREALESRRLVIANHALLLAHLDDLSDIGSKTLLFVDEAHELENAATSALSPELDSGTLHELAAQAAEWADENGAVQGAAWVADAALALDRYLEDERLARAAARAFDSAERDPLGRSVLRTVTVASPLQGDAYVQPMLMLAAELRTTRHHVGLVTQSLRPVIGGGQATDPYALDRLLSLYARASEADDALTRLVADVDAVLAPAAAPAAQGSDAEQRQDALAAEADEQAEAAEQAELVEVDGDEEEAEQLVALAEGEVVYKEGAHASIDGGFVEPALSGAPAEAEHGLSVVRERFVLDLAAFGKDGNQISSKQYERLCRKSRWLDEHGHLVMDAEYASEEAGLEDIDFYVEYLLREHRDGLLAFCFSAEPTADELREALLRSLESVRAIALRADELRSWRDKYFFVTAGYRTRVADDGALGGGDLLTIYRGLTRVTAGSRRAYAAVGPRILDMLASGGVDEEEELMVRGCAYATAVCHANAYVTDALRLEQRTGVLPDGVHVRLDDDWQAGGIWRAETVDDPARYSLGSVPAIIPLGLGYAETRSDLPVQETPSAEEEPIASSQTGFTVVLTVRDRQLGRLRLPAQVVDALAPG